MRFDPNQKQGALPFDQSAMHLDQLASAVVSSLDDTVLSPGCFSHKMEGPCLDFSAETRDRVFIEGIL